MTPVGWSGRAKANLAPQPDSTGLVPAMTTVGYALRSNPEHHWAAPEFPAWRKGRSSRADGIMCKSKYQDRYRDSLEGVKLQVWILKPCLVKLERNEINP